MPYNLYDPLLGPFPDLLYEEPEARQPNPIEYADLESQEAGIREAAAIRELDGKPYSGYEPWKIMGNIDEKLGLSPFEAEYSSAQQKEQEGFDLYDQELSAAESFNNPHVGSNPEELRQSELEARIDDSSNVFNTAKAIQMARSTNTEKLQWLNAAAMGVIYADSPGLAYKDMTKMLVNKGILTEEQREALPGKGEEYTSEAENYTRYVAGTTYDALKIKESDPTSSDQYQYEKSLDEREHQDKIERYYDPNSPDSAQIPQEYLERMWAKYEDHNQKEYGKTFEEMYDPHNLNYPDPDSNWDPQASYMPWYDPRGALGAVNSKRSIESIILTKGGGKDPRLPQVTGEDVGRGVLGALGISSARAEEMPPSEAGVLPSEAPIDARGNILTDENKPQVNAPPPSPAAMEAVKKMEKEENITGLKENQRIKLGYVITVDYAAKQLRRLLEDDPNSIPIPGTPEIFQTANQIKAKFYMDQIKLQSTYRDSGATIGELEQKAFGLMTTWSKGAELNKWAVDEIIRINDNKKKLFLERPIPVDEYGDKRRARERQEENQKYAEREIREEAKARGQDPNKAIAKAKKLGLLR